MFLSSALLAILWISLHGVQWVAQGETTMASAVDTEEMSTYLDENLIMETKVPDVLIQKRPPFRDYDYVPDTTTPEDFSKYLGTHSIICSKSLRPNSQYSLSVSILKPLVSDLNLNINILNQAQVSVAQLTKSGLRFEGMQVFTLNIPATLTDSSYTLRVVGSGGLSFDYTQWLQLNKKQLSIFIQTDKVLYKPGQTVLFRVVVVDSQLKPVTDPIDITITDNFGNRILQATQQNNSGVATNSLKLSEQTPLGTWQIKAVVKDVTVLKTFEVAEYVLPKFEVTVSLPKFYLVNTNNPRAQKDLVATVSAIYTYGKPVDGSATVIIKLQYFWGTSQPTIQKNVQLVDGKAQLVLSLSELQTGILPSGMNINYQTILFSASVVEAATGITLTGNSTVQCTFQKYKLNFLDISPENFKSGLTYVAFLQLTQSDGSAPVLSDIKDKLGRMRNVNVRVECSTVKENITVATTESGYMTFSYNIQGADSCNFNAEYFDYETNSTVNGYKYINAFKTRDLQTIQVIYQNTEGVIKPNTVAKFLIKTSQPITTFNYYILAKSLLYKSATVKDVEAKEHSVQLSVDATTAMQLAPELKIIVTMVTEKNELVADSLTITVVDYFANKVKVSFSTNSTLPGKSVSLKVQANPGSFVGLLAIDQSVLLLRSGNDITKTMVMNDISEYSNIDFFPMPCVFCRFWWPMFPSGKDTSSILENAGVFQLSDVYVYEEIIRFDWFREPMMAMANGMGGAVDDAQPVAPSSPRLSSGNQVRKNFPETWIWSDIKTSSNGDYSYVAKVPDTMTSWVATAFATHPSVGLGIGDDAAKIIVLKKFFISLNLPYSVIRGEEFALQVTVFNYLAIDNLVQVTLAKSTEFYVRNCSNVNKAAVSAVESATISVKKNSAATVYFWIVPIKTGYIQIGVSARAPGSLDSMIATLLVKPEGEPQSYSTSTLLQVTSSTSYTQTFNISLPPTGVLVPNSVYIEVTLIGNIMGSSLNNLDNLLQMPSGCGEQNMLNFAPDVYILLYLEFSNQLNSAVATLATGFLNAGYQRELTYQRSDGSFSAFGNSDTSGSIWLSSFVIKCFHQAMKFIPIEANKIEITLNYIIRLQSADGSFKEPPEGRVIHTDMQGGSASGVALTAYVLIALLENRNISQNTMASINLAQGYLETHYQDHSTSPYALSIIAYAFYLCGSTHLSNVMTTLNSLAINAGGTKHWEETVTTVSNSWQPSYVQTHAVNIETTAYVLLVLASQQDLSASLPIVKWLVTQRNAQGGFASTQDTVVALEALALFSRILPSLKTGSGLQVTISNNINRPSYTFKNITAQNALILQSYQVPTGTTKVSVKAVGVGNGLLQLNVKYNILNVDNFNLLSLDVQTQLVKGSLNLTICTAWKGQEVSGMMVVEINLLTGYSCSYEEQLRRQVGSILKRIDSDSNKLVLYLDELTSKDLCFNLVIDKIQEISNVQKAAIRVYRYYEPITKVIKFYQPSTSVATTWNIACPLCCAASQKLH